MLHWAGHGQIQSPRWEITWLHAVWLQVLVTEWTEKMNHKCINGSLLCRMTGIYKRHLCHFPSTWQQTFTVFNKWIKESSSLQLCSLSMRCQSGWKQLSNFHHERCKQGSWYYHRRVKRCWWCSCSHNLRQSSTRGVVYAGTGKFRLHEVLMW